MSALPIPRCWRATFPISICSIPMFPSIAELERRAQEAEAAGARGEGRHQIRRRVGLGRHRRHGAGHQRRLPRLLSALEPGHLDDRDLRRRHRHGARLRLHLRAACRRSASRPRSVGRSAGERTVARANPRKVETCKVPVVFDPRVSGSLVGHLVGAINGASIARKTSFLKDKLGAAAVCEEHPHHRRSLAQARPALAILRRRGRQGEEARARSTRAC